MPPLNRNVRGAAARRREEGHTSRWNDYLIQRLTALWVEGYTTAEIGQCLGISKNAVVGKVRRLQLPSRPSPIRKRAGTSTRPVSTPDPTPAPDVKPISPPQHLPCVPGLRL